MKPAAQVEMNSIVISTSLIPMLEKEAGKKELKWKRESVFLLNLSQRR